MLAGRCLLGEVRAHDMAYLKTLHVGHGYTADGSKTFPLRGKGVGQMPSLAEVMSAFPGRRFLVNFKSDDPAEGQRFAALVRANPAWCPINYTWLVWGWPARFATRMSSVESTILLRGPHGSADSSDRVDLPKYAEQIPLGFPGFVWTNDLGVLLASPAFASRAVSSEKNGKFTQDFSVP